MILVVDEELDVLLVAREALEKAGMQVCATQDPREAISLFRSQHNEIAAVLLDRTMTHMSGEEVLRELRRIRPDVPVILSSGYGERCPERLGADGRPSAFLPKPYIPDTLVGAVRSVLGGAERDIGAPGEAERVES
jgi:CheY-like chemotaxis protein